MAIGLRGPQGPTKGRMLRGRVFSIRWPWRVGYALLILLLLAPVACGAAVVGSKHGPSVKPPALVPAAPTSYRPQGDSVPSEDSVPSGGAQAAAQARATPAKAPPAAPKLSAAAVVLMDADTGAVLYSLNPHQRRSPASLTKVLTAIVAIERGDLESIARVSANAAGKPPTRLGLRAGDRISLSQLLEATLLASSNDAATAVAEHVGGSEAAFARLMNQTAVKLGAKESNFTNAHGLDASQHYSTAYDLAILARRLLQIPALADLIVKERAQLKWQGGSGEVANINSFLWRYDGALGIKTGYTSKAGYSVAVAAQNGSRRLIAVLLGCPSSEARWGAACQLMDYGFANHTALVAAAAARRDRTYAVRRGDTLSGIAKRFGVAVGALLDANPSLRRNPDLISVGQSLVIP
jgi:D-alanyl-D-alanine carboxypeptidase